MSTLLPTRGRGAAALALCALLAACVDEPAAPAAPAAPGAVRSAAQAEANKAVATLRRATARYHDLQAALDDDFIPFHPCESLPGEGPVGALYVHVGHLLDGAIDPARPDALLYEPGRDGRMTLVGVELAVPYALWPGTDAPRFLGAEFQREDEFAVYALHAWVWRHNPEGMFAESNPRVSCGED